MNWLIKSIKEINKFIIHIEDVGWKFLQKVPKEFRDTYIANQPLGQAFQAICEFLGVDYAYSIEDLEEYSFGADGYSVTKGGEVIEDVETILSKWQTKTEEEEDNMKDCLEVINTRSSIRRYTDQPIEASELINLDKKNKNNAQYVKTVKKNQKLESDEESEEPDERQEEFDEKIMNLFIGNTYYESDVESNILNYDKITVTPTASTDTTNDANSIEKTDDKNKTDQETSNESKNI